VFSGGKLVGSEPHLFFFLLSFFDSDWKKFIFFSFSLKWLFSHCFLSSFAFGLLSRRNNNE